MRRFFTCTPPKNTKLLSALVVIAGFSTSCGIVTQKSEASKLKPDTEREAFLFNDKEFYPAQYTPEYTLRDLGYITEREDETIKITFGNKSLKGKIEMYVEGTNSDKKLKTNLTAGSAGFSVAQTKSLITGKTLKHDVFTVSFKIYDAAGNFITAGKQAFATLPKLQPVNTLTYGPEIISRSQTAITLSYNTHIPCSTIVWHKGASNSIEPETQNHRLTIERVSADTATELIIEINGRRFPYVVPALKKENDPVNFVFTANGTTGGKKGSDQKPYQKVFEKAKTANADLVIFGGNFSNGPFEDAGVAQTQWYLHRFYRDASNYNKPVYTYPGKNEYIKSSYLTADKSVVYAVNQTPAYINATETVFSRVFETPVTRISGERDLKPLFNRNEPHAEYGSTAFAFLHRHTGFIVLNTEYAQTRNHEFAKAAGGNISGYIAKNQLDWLKKQLADFEQNNTVKNVVVCMHSPLFPAAAYSGSAFWYNGNFDQAPKNAKNKSLPGILEIRDKIIAELNNNKKVRTVLSAEPGYNGALSFTKDSNPYPQNYTTGKIIPRNDLLFINFGGSVKTKESVSVPWKNDIVPHKTPAAGLLLEISVDGQVNVKW